MRSVAGGTDRRNGEALREQTFAVDTHRVILEDVDLRNVVSPRHGSTLAVAISAERRNIHHCRWRIHISGRQDVVLAMAIGAGRRHWIALFRCSPMQTIAMRSCHSPMAVATRNSLKFFGMPAALAACEVTVAFNTRHARVGRCRDRLRCDVHRYFRVSTKTGHLRIVVTRKAPGIFLGQRRAPGKPEDCCCHGQPAFAIALV